MRRENMRPLAHQALTICLDSQELYRALLDTEVWDEERIRGEVAAMLGTLYAMMELLE